MISFSRLACDRAEEGDRVRSATPPTGAGPCRVLVWNTTQRCNLRCRHCYAACNGTAGDELSHEEGIALIDDLAAAGVQVLLFSGGEPLMRRGILELVEHAAARGLRPVLSTNGMLITDGIAARLKAAGLVYAGVSLDGTRAVHDAFRRCEGAFDAALAGIRRCRAAGLKVGLRFTLTRDNHAELSGVFDLMRAEGIPRICVYHLAYAGRGAKDADLTSAETRAVLAWLLERTRTEHAAGNPVEVLTVDNHADGPWLALTLRAEGDAAGADRVASLLAKGGGNSSGERIGCVSWDGTVYPDQFWRDAPVGTIRERPFSAIWNEPTGGLLAELRQRERHLRCRCTRCRFLPLCRGNLRSRAAAATGDAWGDDPACHLTDEEIAPG